MSVLLIDAGNTRLKWALLRGRYRRGASFARSGAIAWREAGAKRELAQMFERAGAVERACICNVAGAPLEQALRAAARRAGIQSLQFAHTARAGAGVRNAYVEPWRLGVDRWVALIGARHEYPRRALCIASIGTAMTIDLLDARGYHRGGSITPGPAMMIEALLQGTAGIRRRAGGGKGANGASGRRRGMFARDTRAALEVGARYACGALIERSYAEAAALLGRKPRVIVAGGSAAAIIPLLKLRFERQDDLALRGLAILAQSQSPG